MYRALVLRSRKVMNEMRIILGLGKKVKQLIFGQVDVAIGVRFAINSKLKTYFFATFICLRFSKF